MINGHRHCLAHFQVASEHRVVKIEIHSFVNVICGRSDQRIVAESLVLWHLAHIEQPCRINGPSLQILENGLLCDDVEDDFVQVGLSYTSPVVPGITNQRVVIPWHPLLYHEWAASDHGVEV